MKKTNVKLTISKDPILLGTLTDTQQVDSYAYNLVKQIEKIFNVSVDYNTIYNGNSYRIECSEDPYIEMNVSEFLDSNF